jgi:hypothetical protein
VSFAYDHLRREADDVQPYTVHPDPKVDPFRAMLQAVRACVHMRLHSHVAVGSRYIYYQSLQQRCVYGVRRAGQVERTGAVDAVY